MTRGVGGRAASELLALPVCQHGIELAKPVDALLDPAVDRLLGFEVLCGDGAHRFLPFSVAEIRPDEIAIGSALRLIHARWLSELGYVDPWVDAAGEVYEALSAA
jgi:hypothetical protein